MLHFINMNSLSLFLPLSLSGEDSDSDSDLSLEEERSLSIPSSESEDNVRLRGRIQRRFKRSNHSERLLTEPAQNGTKGEPSSPLTDPLKATDTQTHRHTDTQTHFPKTLALLNTPLWVYD